MPRYLRSAKTVEKATYAADAALPPASQHIESALAENGEAPVAVLKKQKTMLAEAIVLVPISDAEVVASEDVRRGGTHKADHRNPPPPPPLTKSACRPHGLSWGSTCATACSNFLGCWLPGQLP
jgi:hypothetical protein